MIEEFVHVGISVFDLKESVRFYTEALGMEIDYTAHHEGEKISRAVGVEDCELNITAVKRDQDSPGLIHLAFKVADVDEVYDRLKRMGYDFNSEPMATRESGPKICCFRGPDHVIMELYEVAEK